MANKSRNRLNQPPTGEGKKQSPQAGAEVEMEQIVHIDFGRSGK